MEHLLIKLDGRKYDEAVHGGLDDDLNRDPPIRVQLPDGSLARAQAVTTADLLRALLTCLDCWSASGYLDGTTKDTKDTTMTRTIESQIGTRMTAFVRTFPTLRAAEGLEPWHAFKFARWATNCIDRNTAESQAAAFALAVWNGGQPADGGWWNTEPFGVGRFDAIKAVALWDGGHCAAFVDWCLRPFWP